MFATPNNAQQRQPAAMFYGSYAPFYDAAFAPSGGIPVTTVPFPAGYYAAPDATPYVSFQSESTTATAAAPAGGTYADPLSSDATGRHSQTVRYRRHSPSTGFGVAGVPPKPSRQTLPNKAPSNAEAKTKTPDGLTPCQFYLRTGTCAFGNR